MADLRIIEDGKIIGVVESDSIKKAKHFVDCNFPFDFNVEFEFSTINPENRVENTIKILPNGQTNRNPKPN